MLLLTMESISSFLLFEMFYKINFIHWLCIHMITNLGRKDKSFLVVEHSKTHHQERSSK